MSIATLKKKSNALHSNVSKHGFYLNGILRLPTHTLIRTPTRTILKGIAPVGHGTGSNCRIKGVYARYCTNKYPIVIHNTGTPELQTGVKRSTMNTWGMLEKRYMGILHGTYPNTVVAGKPSINQSEFTNELARNQFKSKCKQKQDNKKGVVRAEGQPSDVSHGICPNYAVNLTPDTYHEYQVKLTANCVNTDVPSLPVKNWNSC
jgi:hypothetical protein